jgi:hypothetical protein
MTEALSAWHILLAAIGIALICTPAICVSLEAETPRKRAFGFICILYFIAAPWLALFALLAGRMQQ